MLGMVVRIQLTLRCHFPNPLFSLVMRLIIIGMSASYCMTHTCTPKVGSRGYYYAQAYGIASNTYTVPTYSTSKVHC